MKLALHWEPPIGGSFARSTRLRSRTHLTLTLGKPFVVRSSLEGEWGWGSWLVVREPRRLLRSRGGVACWG